MERSLQLVLVSRCWKFHDYLSPPPPPPPPPPPHPPTRPPTRYCILLLKKQGPQNDSCFQTVKRIISKCSTLFIVSNRTYPENVMKIHLFFFTIMLLTGVQPHQEGRLWNSVGIFFLCRACLAGIASWKTSWKILSFILFSWNNEYRSWK